jgi:HEPN domain-containing protein
MSGPDPALEAERRREAGRWLVIALEDIRVARMCLAMAEPARGAAAYHCQQAAEKLIKGLLVAAAIDFRKTHDLDELADLAASSYPDCQAVLDATRPFTVWGLAYRYPSVEDSAEPEQTESVLQHALAVADQLAGRLRPLTR